MRIQIKNRWTDALIYEGGHESWADAVKHCVDSKIDLRGANLRGADLSGSDLRDSNLRYSDLSGSDLRYSDLSGSNLRGSDLSGSDLRGSDLSGSDLRGSNLRGADLSGSNLRGSDLRDSNLNQAYGQKWVSCGWSEHGECGRVLTAMIIDGAARYFCGCFRGSESDLRKYIEQGDVSLAKSRTVALEFCAARLAEMA